MIVLTLTTPIAFAFSPRFGSNPTRKVRPDLQLWCGVIQLKRFIANLNILNFIVTEKIAFRNLRFNGTNKIHCRPLASSLLIVCTVWL